MNISDIRRNNLLQLIEQKANGSQKDFANHVGTAAAYLSQIINGTIGNNGKPAAVGNPLARKIEKAYGLPDGYMDRENSKIERFDNNVDLKEKITTEGRLVPVISWVAAGSFSPIETVLRDAVVDEFLPPNTKCGKNGYGLKITGNSMLPRFEPGDRIYVNPDIQTFDLQTNDLVIVACAGETEATFKKLIIEGNNRYLEPLNPDWPEKIIRLTEDCRLVGKVVGLYRDI
ncbi:TPA: XRE family transcriptional regulator [Acinetobacter baumannii]|nr:XRE family transcriptional regulator [Acinetobacter baumannii]HAV5029386.1 XRE family transcriptional regulator [Acinetobacter baumannii]HEO1775966.1 LexA family transcriptional repressor [Acinetobacter baumannii]HEO1779373.1 LexA family transcriptional repressor [Acinetobacter baumannii]